MSDSVIDFDELNHSELVKLAHWVDMKDVTRALPREMIIEALEQNRPINIPNPVNKKRKKLSNWMKRHWRVLEMQVKKSECPNCDLCQDIQVVECYTDNKHHFT